MLWTFLGLLDPAQIGQISNMDSNRSDLNQTMLKGSFNSPRQKYRLLDSHPLWTFPNKVRSSPKTAPKIIGLEYFFFDKVYKRLLTTKALKLKETGDGLVRL